MLLLLLAIWKIFEIANNKKYKYILFPTGSLKKLHLQLLEQNKTKVKYNW